MAERRFRKAKHEAYAAVSSMLLAAVLNGDDWIEDTADPDLTRRALRDLSDELKRRADRMAD